MRQLPQDFDDIKAAIVDKVNNVITKDAIPDDLVINWDRTGVNMVPGGTWTMEEQGFQQVPIHGMDDKRQITVLLAVTKSYYRRKCRLCTNVLLIFQFILHFSLRFKMGATQN